MTVSGIGLFPQGCSFGDHKPDREASERRGKPAGPLGFVAEREFMKLSVLFPFVVSVSRGTGEATLGPAGTVHG